MIFLSDLNHDLNQRFKSNDLNHNNPAYYTYTYTHIQCVPKVPLLT